MSANITSVAHDRPEAFTDLAIQRPLKPNLSPTDPAAIQLHHHRRGKWCSCTVTLPREVEARWRLVETAWELNLPRHVLSVGFDPEGELLVVNDRLFGRKPITSCRDALNGYQKGKCFYCFNDISVLDSAEDLADVDHFFPHTLKPFGLGEMLDGVWNLVLACQSCNRGAKGKFAQLPELRFLERLHTRNSFYIESHHPLRETLILQTGTSEPERRRFLQETYRQSKELLVQNWRPEFEHEPAF